MIRWQKRRGFDTPPPVMQYVGVNPKFPGQGGGGDYFNSGGSESRSGGVWSRENDRGANPPVGKSPPDYQNSVLKKPNTAIYIERDIDSHSNSILLRMVYYCQQCNNEISRLDRHPLPKGLTIGKGSFSDQNLPTPPPKSSSRCVELTNCMYCHWLLVAVLTILFLRLNKSESCNQFTVTIILWMIHLVVLAVLGEANLSIRILEYPLLH